METKKTHKADLENKKNIFFEIGLIIAVSAVLVAFEWKTVIPETSDFITTAEDITDEIIIPITQMSRAQPPPPPPALRLADMIQIIEEEDLFTDDLELSEANINTNPGNTSNHGLLNNDLYTDEIDAAEDAILPFVPAEDMPQFPNLQSWVAKHIKYPELAKEYGIQGKVYIQFVVEKDGSVSNVKVMRSVDASLDKEAIRVIQSMPKWTPGKQRGKPVRVSYNMPIYFQLSN